MTSGVVSLAELRAAEMTAEELEGALASGRLRRVVRGWFASPLAQSDEVAAITAGGRLGCLSACKAHGLWTPPILSPHVIVGRGATKRGPNWHRVRERLPSSAVYPLEECLEHVVRHHDPETALMVLESAMEKGRITPNKAQVIAATGANHKQRLLDYLDSGAGSGLETRVRLFVQRHRFRVQTQVEITGVGRVDMLVGQSLIIECDGDEFHRDPKEDRRRDLAARALGYRVMRLSYEQIMHTWEASSAALLAVLKSGEHLLPPFPLPNPK